MKIFNHNKSSLKETKLKNTNHITGNKKLLPAYSKEWKNTAYFFNKNSLKNIPNNSLLINKIIKSYFNLYLKEDFVTGTAQSEISKKQYKRFLSKKERNFSKIFISNPEIKFNNYKTRITLYMINREKIITKNKYYYFNTFLLNSIENRYMPLYANSLERIHDILEEHFHIFNFDPRFLALVVRKKKLIKYRFDYLKRFINFKNKYLITIIYHILNDFFEKHLKLITKYELKHSLNQLKFNNLYLLPKLSNILNKVLDKKIEYNIVNLKSITNNTDIFTNMLAILIRRKKKQIALALNLAKILRKVRLPRVNKIKERTRVRNIINYSNKNYPKLISNLIQTNNLNSIINNEKNVHQTIFNSINYKNLSGIRIEVKGRLTKRYRADRAIYRLRYIGGLRNVYSSYQGLSSVLFRGNEKSNISSSLFKSKRRIGSFAVKGWIGGK